MNMIPAISSVVFTYQELKEKAQREIDRLEKAEFNLEDHVMDHALNAAFSVFHLLEWREKTNTPMSKRKAHDLCDITQNTALNVLHDIVTCNKHVTVSKPKHSGTLDVRVSAAVNHILLENGDYLTTEDGNHIMTEDSKMIVKFGNDKALEILKAAIAEFT